MTKNSKNTITLKSNTGRRAFIKKSALFFGGISIVPRHVLGQGFVAPSDKINLGFIGLGKQGGILANYFVSKTEVQIVAGAEVWLPKQDWFKGLVGKYYAEKRNRSAYDGVTTYTNYLDMIEIKDIDAVVIATPDHWHAIQAIDAMNSGKDVYCEKPMANTLKEGKAMVEAVANNKSIFQVGSMQRSWGNFIKAQEVVSSGGLGKIRKVLVNVGDPAIPYNLPEESLPEGLDWNLWCGPSPMLPYNSLVAPKVVKTYPKWRDFKETAGGILADWGTHMFDVAQWCLGTDRTGPITYIPPENPKATRGLQMFYKNGVEMVHEDFGRGWGVRFIGDSGSMDVSRKYLDISSSLIPDLDASEKEKLFKDKGNHYQNWISAIKTRKQPICDVEIGHRSASICNIANIAYELNEPLNWNPDKEKFKKNRSANKMRKRKIRDYN